MLVFHVFGAISLITGVAFSALGVLGILRLPDTYSRLHASGKTSTLGVIFICVGTGFIRPSATLELMTLSIFVIFSGPVGSHAIAAAVHRGVAARNLAAEESGNAAVLVSGVHRIPEEFLKSQSEGNSPE